MQAFLAALISVALAACVPMSSSGERAGGFARPEIAAAYLPLEAQRYLVLQGHGAAMVIRPGIAVTNAHNAPLVAPETVIGVSPGYDLMFFRVSGGRPLAMAAPSLGERVTAYGQGSDGSLRVAEGTVRWLDAPVEARCPSCPVQHPFAFEGDAGAGFSGGPVLDAASGALLGIVFGYNDEAGSGRLIYAYDMARVNAELAAVEQHAGALSH
jgi:hypothetical protein